MGHKTNPIGFRLGIIKDHQSHWYARSAKGEYRTTLLEDVAVREMIIKDLKDAAVPRVEIDRSGNQISVRIHTARPGVVIGRSGQRVEELRQKIEKLTGKKAKVDIIEIRVPEMEAALVGASIAEQLAKRVAFKRAIKQAADRTMQRGAKGVRIVISGRLGGAEMSRREREVRGSVPLHTLRADIDYAQTEALTTFGQIGIKVWIYKGDVLPEKNEPLEKREVVPSQATIAGTTAAQSVAANDQTSAGTTLGGARMGTTQSH